MVQQLIGLKRFNHDYGTSKNLINSLFRELDFLNPLFQLNSFTIKWLRSKKC